MGDGRRDPKKRQGKGSKRTESNIEHIQQMSNEKEKRKREDLKKKTSAKKQVSQTIQMQLSPVRHQKNHSDIELPQHLVIVRGHVRDLSGELGYRLTGFDGGRKA